MLINVDNVNVAVPQQLVDAYIALDNFEKSGASQRLGDDAYSMQFDGLVNCITALSKASFPNYNQSQFDQLEDQIWSQFN